MNKTITTIDWIRYSSVEAVANSDDNLSLGLFTDSNRTDGHPFGLWINNELPVFWGRNECFFNMKLNIKNSDLRYLLSPYVTEPVKSLYVRYLSFMLKKHSFLHPKKLVTHRLI